MAFIGILAFSFLHGVNNCGCSSHTYSVTIPFSLKKFVKTHGSAVFGCWQFWFDEKILPYFSLDTFDITTKKSWNRILTLTILISRQNFRENATVVSYFAIYNFSFTKLNPLKRKNSVLVCCQQFWFHDKNPWKRNGSLLFLMLTILI